MVAAAETPPPSPERSSPTPTPQTGVAAFVLLGTATLTWSAVAFDQGLGSSGLLDRAASADATLEGSELWAYPLGDALLIVGASTAIVIAATRARGDLRWRQVARAASAALAWCGVFVAVGSIATGLALAAGVSGERWTVGLGGWIAAVVTSMIVAVALAPWCRWVTWTDLLISAAYLVGAAVALGSVGLGFVPALATSLVVGLVGTLRTQAVAR